MPGPLMSKGPSYDWLNCTAVTLRRSLKNLEIDVLSKHARQTRRKFCSKCKKECCRLIKHCIQNWPLTIDGNPKKKMISSDLLRSLDGILKPFLRNSGREVKQTASRKQRELLSNYDKEKYLLTKIFMKSWSLNILRGLSQSRGMWIRKTSPIRMKSQPIRERK